ncbi:hypothetical protein F5883DRAFT_673074 [Diaporthe sp. PMI_573]|nr:hypothetical protein F5883DRAFT_673074 [Diaporthaceae sp. PMI_573]
MSTLQKTQGNTAPSRSAKPKLTIDTRAHIKPNADLLYIQSAPVGTRQERGIPPMYQAVDRHCTKVAEMMNSPTWRSQRHKPTIVDNGGPFEPLDPHQAYTRSPLAPCVEDDEAWDSAREEEGANAGFPSPTRQRAQRRHADSGISLGRDAEAMNILSIHPLSEVPDSPTKTFIISASVSNGAAHSRGAIYGELQPVIIPNKQSESQDRTTGDDLSSELDSEYDSLGNSETDFQGSSPSPCHLSGQSQSGEGLDEQDVLVDQRTKNKERDIRLLMERDAAIKSVNSQQASPRGHRHPEPEDTQRFQGLLGRLLCEAEALKGSPTDGITLNDPAIVSFAPKKSMQNPVNKQLAAELPLEENRCQPKGKRHTASDSGYASSTRTLSRSRHGTSDEIGIEPVTIQNGRAGSKKTESHHSSKSSTLNPAAKVFSSTNDHSASPAKRNILASPVPNHIFSPPSLGQAQFGTGIHSQSLGYNAMPRFDSPLVNLALPQAGSFQVSPALLPQSVPFPLPAIPPPPGFGLAPGLAPGIQGIGNIPSLPLRPSPSAMGLTRPAQPLGSVPTAGPIPSEFMGAFHHQLPTIPSCNNPAHQNDAAFSATQGFPAPTMPQLAPPAPPASLFSPTHRAPMPPPMAPAAPVMNPIFRKNVPKPKVPNTTGQQYWEYWHELRRTFEPGYAQKSKQNQQKRYMKQQIHKDDGTTEQA